MKAAAAVKKPTAKKPPPLPARRARGAPPIAAPPTRAVGKSEPMANAGVTAPVAEWVALAKIRVWAKNPRKNDGKPVEAIAESIKRFGWGRPLVARAENLELIVGHTARKAALLLAEQYKVATPTDRKRWHDEAVFTCETGLVPVRRKSISESEAHLLALADNRTGEFSEWDVPELHDILSDYDLDDATLAGWDEADMAKLSPDVDDDADGGTTNGNGKKDDNHCPHCGRYMSAKLKALHRARDGKHE